MRGYERGVSPSPLPLISLCASRCAFPEIPTWTRCWPTEQRVTNKIKNTPPSVPSEAGSNVRSNCVSVTLVSERWRAMRLINFHSQGRVTTHLSIETSVGGSSRYRKFGNCGAATLSGCFNNNHCHRFAISARGCVCTILLNYDLRYLPHRESHRYATQRDRYSCIVRDARARLSLFSVPIRRVSSPVVLR